MTVNHKGTKGKMSSVEILSLSILLKKAVRVTPSLPQRGRQPKGSISWPHLYISPVPKENLSSTSRELSHFSWMHQRGGVKGCRSSKKCQNNFPMISINPKNGKKGVCISPDSFIILVYSVPTSPEHFLVPVLSLPFLRV